MSEEIKVKSPFLHDRLKALLKEKEELWKELQPARDTYERLVNDPELIAARKKIKESNSKLGLIDQELAFLTKALGSKVLKTETGVYSNGE